MINVIFENDIKTGSIVNTSFYSYSIIREIDRGVNGIIYSAICLNGERKDSFFAIKVLHNLDSKIRKLRFSNEYLFLKSCNHKNIVKVYEDGEIIYKNISYPFFVMPLFETTLDAKILNNELTYIEKITYAVQILSVALYLKEKGYIHRDLKPKNILINGHDLAICDFGIVKQIDPWISPGSFYKIDDYSRECVPYAFRSPEILEYIKNGSKITYHSDIFQIGLTFCMLFCGKHPLLLSGDYTKKLEPIIFKEPLDTFLKGLEYYPLGVEIINIIKNMLKFESEDANETLHLYKKMNQILLSIVNTDSRPNGDF